MFETAFFQTSHVEITFQDAEGFDLIPDMVNPIMNSRLELYLGYHPSPQKIFEGHVVAMEPYGDRGENPKIRIKAYDYSWLLKVPREPSIYTDTNLLSIINNMVKIERAKLTLEPIINPSEPLHKFKAENYRAVNQIDMTDWEFLSKAARLVNYKLWCNGTQVYMVDQNYLQSQQIQENTYIYRPFYGQIDNDTAFPLLAFNPRAAREGQRLSVEVISWSSISERGIKKGEGELGDLKDKGFAYTEMITRSEVTEKLVIEQFVESSADAKRIAEKILRERADQLVKGNAIIVGDPNIQIGQRHILQMNTFGQCGRLISGEYQIIGVKHNLSKAGFITEFDINRDRLGEDE
jgi:phage protein D